MLLINNHSDLAEASVHGSEFQAVITMLPK